jgi:hypothetical protein
VYIETHTAQTDNAGMFSLGIGSGAAQDGVFSIINWQVHPKFLRVELDVGDGRGLTLISTVQLATVPYAFFAAKAEESVRDADSQLLSISENLLSISNGNSVVLPRLGQWNSISAGLSFDGQIGIGTTNPRSQLDVVSNEGNSRYSLSLSATNNTGQAGLAAHNNANGWLKVAVLGSNVQDGAAFGQNGQGTVQILSNQAGAKDMLIGTLNNQSVLIGTNNRPRLTVAQTGDVIVSDRVAIRSSSFPTDVAVPLSIRGIDSQGLGFSDLVQFRDRNDTRQWHLKLLNSGDLVFVKTGVAQDRLVLTAMGNIGVGTVNPSSRLTVRGVIESTTGGIKFPDGSVQTTAAPTAGVSAGVVLRSPNGACWRISVDNTGNIIRTSIPCP